MVFRKKNRQINLKSNREIQSMRVAGHLAAQCLEWIINQVAPKMSTQDIDDLQCQFAKKHAVICAPLNYRGFPKSICTSVNEVICHGIPDSVIISLATKNNRISLNLTKNHDVLLVDLCM